MNRTHAVVAGWLLVSVAIAGCASSANPGASATSAVAAPSAVGATVAPSPRARIWGGFATSILYGSFAEWARDVRRGTGAGVALVRVTDVSRVRWSTASGQGPSDADVARVNRGEVEFTIGRLVTVDLVRMLRGTWPGDDSTALYWLPGGRIGPDMTLAYSGDAMLNEPTPGGVAVAGTFAGTDMDGTDGVLFVTVQMLFPADAAGRIRTYNPDETITVGDLDRYLPIP